MHCQDSHSGRKSNVAVARDPVADGGAASPFVVVQHGAKVPALESGRRHKRGQASCSTHVAHYVGRAVTTATTLCIFGLCKEAVGRIDHAVAARALCQPLGTLNKHNTSRTHERIRQAEGNSSIGAGRRESSS
jgi:hypothetical protein